MSAATPPRSTLTEALRRERVPEGWGAKYCLWVHEQSTSKHELILNPDIFPTCQAGNLVTLVNPSNGRMVHLRISAMERSFRQASFQLSVCKEVADAFGLAPRRDVYVTVRTGSDGQDCVEAMEELCVGNVEVSFRDQYIGRLPMRQILMHLLGQGVYVGRPIELSNACVRARVCRIFDRARKEVDSGVVVERSFVTLRSETAKISIFLQISRESFTWDSITGQTYMEKAIDGFLYELFERWKGEKVNHMVSLVLTARIVYLDDHGTDGDDGEEEEEEEEEEGQYNGKDEQYGQREHDDKESQERTKREQQEKKINANTREKVKDFYSVVIDWECHSDWAKLLPMIRQEALKMANLIEGKVKSGKAYLVDAHQGNILEAVNLALKVFDKHFVDRDLSKTGMAIIFITPGNGRITLHRDGGHVLGRIAKRKVLDDGIWLQLVALAPPPLHLYPLLEIYGSSEDDAPFKYYKPYWFDCGYYRGQSQWVDNGEGMMTNSTQSHLPSIQIDWKRIRSLATMFPSRRRDDGSRDIYKGSTGETEPFFSFSSLPSLLSGSSPSSSSESGSPPSPTSPRVNATINPFNPTAISPMRHCFICSAKWKGVFALSAYSEGELHWDLMISPPCLPLSCPFAPSPQEFHQDYECYRYQVDLYREGLFLPTNATASVLANELLLVRLALGMQQVKPFYHQFPEKTLLTLEHEYHMISINSDNSVLVERYTRKRRKIKEKKRNKEHIEPDEHAEPDEHVGADEHFKPTQPSQTQCEIPSSNRHHQFNYSAWIKPHHHSHFCKRHIAIRSFGMANYPWEEVDKMIAGGGNYQVRGARWWQSRFILIPMEDPPKSFLIMATAANDILNDEELRVAGFLKFLEVFQRAALSLPAPCRELGTKTGQIKTLFGESLEKKLIPSPIEALNILITTKSLSAYAHQQVFHSSLFPPSTMPDEQTMAVQHVEPLKRTSSIDEVALLMQHPLVGIKSKARRWHWRIYRDVFVGSEGVDWLIKFFDDLQTREEAVAYGNWLMERGVWEHVHGTHSFLDGYYYYRFSTKYDPKTLRVNIEQRIRPDEDTGDGQARAEGGVEMSRSILINVDLQQRSPERREWAVLHYDSTHNPKNTYHFRLHWLSCSARLIDDLIQSWARRAAQCGFILVEVPVEEMIQEQSVKKESRDSPSPPESTTIMPEIPPSSDSSTLPFHEPLEIPLVVDPPNMAELRKVLGSVVRLSETFYVEELLVAEGFVLDRECDGRFPKDPPNGDPLLIYSYDRPITPRTQFVHSSGVAIVQVTPKSLLWTANRLLLASVATTPLRPQQSWHFFAKEAQLRQRMTDLCADPVALSQYWHKITRRFSGHVDIDRLLDNITDDLAMQAEDETTSAETFLEQIKRDKK